MMNGKGKGTLFTYFKPVQVTQKKSPIKRKHSLTAKIEQENEEPFTKPLISTPTSSRKTHVSMVESDHDSEDDIGRPKNLSGRPKRQSSMSIEERKRNRKKRNRILMESDDDDEDEEGSVNNTSLIVNTSSSSLLMNDSMDSHDMTTPVKKTPRTSKTVRTPGSILATPSSVLSTPTTQSPNTSFMSVTSGCGLEKIGTFHHDTLDFIKDSHRKDKNGKKVNDPNYNQRTLFVPSHYLNKLTPAMRQWWTIKSDNYDTILFFKVGKFYELYHMDAVIGVQELKLVFMKGDFAHAGFPEKAFGRYSQTLVQKGYR